MKYVELYKPGTTKTQMVEPDQVQRYRTYGWVPRDTVHEASAVVHPVKKKTAKSTPAVEYTLMVNADSPEEVVTNDNRGD
jgi:hypothetical protein